MRTVLPTLFAATPLLLLACSEDQSSADPPAGTGGAGTGIGGSSTASGGASSTGGGTSTNAGGTMSGGSNSSAGGATGSGSSGGSDPGSGGSQNNSGGSDPGSGGSDSASGGMNTGGGEMVASPSCPYTPPQLPDTFPEGWTAGDVTQFNDNGGWTWYNDERAVVDTEAGKIVVGSASSNASNQTSDTSITVVIHDLATGANEKKSVGSLSYSDDHNNPGIVMTGSNQYFAAYAHHNVDCFSYWTNYAAGEWSDTFRYTWGLGCPWGTRPDEITYNNPWHMSAEGRYYNFVRSVETSPNFLYSDDEGQTWTYGGRLTASAQQGYNAGYLKYWGNGVDRIDFFSTESHPRDSNTSVYHGYVMGEKSYDSFGVVQDENIYDGDAPQITEFTKIFSAGDTLDGAQLNKLWNFDVARYADGTIGVLWQGRESLAHAHNENYEINTWDPGHHMAYSRFDGTEWKSTRLVRGGRTLYRRNSGDWWEEDYLGGAALDPDDPSVIYVSTNIDPRDDTTEYTWNEIWKGVTCDDGATFQWTPMTMNSPAENLRPTVPKWDTQNTALLWFRGEYNTAQEYNAEVVGILTR